MQYYAHTRGRDKQLWEPLDVHLARVSRLAAHFAEAFEARDWGALAGSLHDLGKYSVRFQRYLDGKERSAHHRATGACFIRAQAKERDYSWVPIAEAIVGHHGGLLDQHEFRETLREHVGDVARIHEAASHIVAGKGLPALPAFLEAERQDPYRRRIELFTRFLFSALVDADYLATQDFYAQGHRQAVLPRGTLIPQLVERLEQWTERLRHGAPPTRVNRVRDSVLQACRGAASRARGVFSLTVPTGGGKTLSGMDFALRHASAHDLLRVIVVIPFTSIIEQNASIYRQALGSDNVIEHHSGLDPEKESEYNRLASENWDAPVVVTTTVQFFESLFAHKPSRCRKVHNIAKSVVVLDEVQALPPRLLLPIVELLRGLVTDYGCSVLLSTASQPALRRRKSFPAGLENVQEIIPDPQDLFRQLRRVRVQWPEDPDAVLPYEDLAEQLLQHPQVLVVVHRREDARHLAELMPRVGTHHLSARMCPAHRLKELACVKDTLHSGNTCRLVSTQLVEAGVDISFPVVYRVLGGLDSIIQAAGRCNREGEADLGQVVVFRAATSPPPGVPELALQRILSLLKETQGPVDIHDPELCTRYFRMLYGPRPADERGILAEREQLNFATVSERFRLIDEGRTRPVVVPYCGADERLESLRKLGPTRQTLRALQPYLVNLYPQEYDALDSAGALEVVAQTIVTLSPPYQKLYHPHFGLLTRDVGPDGSGLVL